MTTFFVDYENGNDDYAGTSFDLIDSGTDGRISSTTFSSTTASFPDDGSLIGQYLSIYNGSIYAVYEITAWESSTSLTIAQIPGGTSLSNQTVDRQYYIGGRWKILTTGATGARIKSGDAIRVMGSPAPTSIGSASWVSGKQESTVTPGNGQFTNTTPIVVNRTNHGLTTGDVVVVTGVSGNTNANGTWDITVIDSSSFSLDGSSGNGTSNSGNYRLRNNTRITLDSTLTQTIASTGPRSAWTASANVTATLNTADYKEHQYSDSIAIASGFTTGKAAYWATGTLDLSGYQQVSFWIKQTAGTIGAADACSIALCSDTTGDTVVNTINIPRVQPLNQWCPVTVDLGSALGSSIQSIAFYVNTDNGAQTFLLSNIIACKASSSDDALTLTSLIGKNINNDTWYGIQSISGTRIMLDASTNDLPTSSSLRGYCHPSGSETVTTYKRETIKTDMVTGSTTDVQRMQEGGVSLSGGWDRTNMSVQNLQTWFDGQNGLGNGLIFSSDATYDNFGLVRYGSGTNNFALVSATVSNIHGNNNTFAGISINHGSVQTDGNTVTNCFAAMNARQGLNLGFGNGSVSNLYAFGNNSGNIVLTTTSNTTYTNLQTYNSSSFGLGYAGTGGAGFVNCKIINCVSYYNNQNGIDIGGAAADVTLVNCDSQFNGFRGFSLGSGGGTKLISCNTADNNASFEINGGEIFAKNCTFNETTELNQTNIQYRNFRLYSENHDNTSGNHRIFADYGIIVADTANRHTESGFSWKLSPLSSTYRTSDYPLDFSLAKVAVAANVLVTIKAWMYRDNSDLTMRLVCKGGQINGVPSDVVSTVSSTESWEEQTITFTPTEQGVVEITAEAYGGSTYNGWVDDMSITQ